MAKVLMGPSTVRIFSPFMSSGFRTCFVLVVRLRVPYHQLMSRARTPLRRAAFSFTSCMMGPRVSFVRIGACSSSVVPLITYGMLRAPRGPQPA